METAQGLDAVQLPLKERYPYENQGDVPGIDAWLTVFRSGLMLQYVNDKSAKTWFPIQTLHVCAAVKCIVQLNGATGDKTPKFVALDSAAAENTRHPPMFACIMRRTKGVKVLECHVFISKSNQAAMALVQASTHAYEHKESWTDDRPEVENTLPTRLIPAVPPPKADAPPEFYTSPPEQGYFYASDKELVKNYNVMGGKKDNDERIDGKNQNEQEGPPPINVHTLVPQAVPTAAAYPAHIHNSHLLPVGAVPVPRGPMPGPVPGVMAAPMMPGIPLMAVPPPGYFADWNMYGGHPVAVMGDNAYGQRINTQMAPRKHHKNTSLSPRPHGHTRQNAPSKRVKHYTDYASPVDDFYSNHRPNTPPVDYDGSYNVKHSNDRKAASDLIMYADNYQDYSQEQLEKDGKYTEYNSNFSPEIFMREPGDKHKDAPYSPPRGEEYDHKNMADNYYDPYNGHYEKELPARSDDRRYPMQNREFSNSIMEERNVVGDYAGYPNAYKLNIDETDRDNDSHIDYDIFHRREQESGGFENLENTLGYFP